jgi:hypothetical protein
MKDFIERVVDTHAVKVKTFKLAAHLLGRKKHCYLTRSFKLVTVENVTYLRNAASVVFCTKCGNELNLIGRELSDLTFDEMYSCSGQKPVDPRGPKGIPNVSELLPAS